MIRLRRVRFGQLDALGGGWILRILSDTESECNARKNGDANT